MRKRLFLPEKSVLFWVCGFLLMASLTVKGDDLYVYKNDGTIETVSPNDLQKLTFTETDMVVHLKDGNVISVDFNELRLFSLIEYDFPDPGTGITELSTKQYVYPNPVADELKISSKQKMTELTISDLQGRKLIRIYPETSEATVSLAAYPKGIYFLQIVEENGTTIKKIIKN